MTLPGQTHSSTPSPREPRGRLLCILGAGFGLAVSIGNTIASGIARTPGEIAASVSSPAAYIALWLAGGFYALLGANCLAELGAAIPRSGGQYAYSRRALGEYAGFIVGWSDWLSTCGTAAAVALVAAEYLGTLPLPFQSDVAVTAIVLILAFALLQWRGLRWGSTLQNFISVAKALAFIALAAACLLSPGAANEPAPLAGGPVGALSLSLALVTALQSVFYTYDGWSGPVYFAEETRAAGSAVPRALFGGVLAVTAIYLAVNLALLHVLPLARIAGEDFAIGSAASAVFGPRGDAIARAVMVLSLLAGLNAYHLMASRVAYAMASDGLFWRSAAGVNRGGTPAASLWIGAGVAVLFVALSGTFRELIGALAFFFVANYAMSFLALFVLRRREPDLPRPFRAIGHPWTTALALCGSVAFLAGAVASDLQSGGRASVYALVLLLASWPVFAIVKRRRAGSDRGDRDLTEIKK